jgi:glycosyltransferase 2 family protein
MRGVGLPATFTQAATMVGIIGLGSVVPAGPGMFGAFQIASFSALALFFPLTEVRSGGAALVFVAYVAQLVMACAQLGVGFTFMARSRVPAQ